MVSVLLKVCGFKETLFAHSLNPRCKSFTSGVRAECSLFGRKSTLMKHLCCLCVCESVRVCVQVMLCYRVAGCVI